MTVSAVIPTDYGHKPFLQFIQEFKAQLKHLFYVRSDINQLSIKRGMPPFILREIMSSNPLATYIPEQYGGRGGHIHEGLALAAAAVAIIHRNHSRFRLRQIILLSGGSESRWWLCKSPSP